MGQTDWCGHQGSQPGPAHSLQLSPSPGAEQRELCSTRDPMAQSLNVHHHHWRVCWGLTAGWDAGKSQEWAFVQASKLFLEQSNQSQPHRQRKASQLSQLANIIFFLLRKSKIPSIKAYLKYHSTFVWVHCYSSSVWLMDPWSKWVVAAVETYFCPAMTSCSLECADRFNQIFNCVLSKANRKGIQWPVKIFPKENTHFLLKKNIKD